MLIPSLETNINTNGIHMESDENDLYVLQKCIIWLLRHILRYPCFDTETMKLVCWGLGEEMQKLGNYLLSQMNETNREKFEEELVESVLTPDDYAPEISRILRQIKSINKRKFSQYISMLMNQKFVCLKFRGKSEIEKNIIALKKLFDLSEKEAELCTFIFIVNTYSYAEEYFTTHMECHRFAGQKYLANILGFSKKELHTIIYGKLKRIGLYEVDKWGISPEDKFLNLIQNPSDKNLSKKFYISVPKGKASLKDYFIKKDRITHILELLKEKSESPTHILLYGPPGTGKTSFAYSLLDKLRVPAYEIVRGEENTTKHRRSAIMACLNMTDSDQGSIVLIDEADNLLNTQGSWLMRGETQDKGWLNHLLDQAGTRMIWITNRIESIEDSVLRRFAFSLHFKSFNRRQRGLLWENILRKNKCKKYCSSTIINNFAKRYAVCPGVIDLAIKKAKGCGPSSKAQFIHSIKVTLESYETLVNNGEKPIKRDEIEKNYSLDGLNINGDLDATFNQLEAFDAYLRNSYQSEIMNINLLFYGPPGTGKSELARYVAEKLGREIICKHVSDIQDKYVGETEKNIKNVFLDAEREEAILVFDEADSLLFSRNRAKRSWEISFVNEFLTQMERFRGILICTTNRMNDIDQASIRRFNHKIGFDYLTADGNQILYDLFLKPLANIPLCQTNREKIGRINHLTPGDFKVVRDRYSFYSLGDVDHNMMIEALAKESDIKLQQSDFVKKIGF